MLLKAEHEKLWDITKEVLKGVVPADQFEGTAQKIDGFRAGYGTVCFFSLWLFHSLVSGLGCLIFDLRSLNLPSCYWRMNIN